MRHLSENIRVPIELDNPSIFLAVVSLVVPNSTP